MVQIARTCANIALLSAKRDDSSANDEW